MYVCSLYYSNLKLNGLTFSWSIIILLQPRDLFISGILAMIYKIQHMTIEWLLFPYVSQYNSTDFICLIVFFSSINVSKFYWQIIPMKKSYTEIYFRITNVIEHVSALMFSNFKVDQRSRIVDKRLMKCSKFGNKVQYLSWFRWNLL